MTTKTNLLALAIASVAILSVIGIASAVSNNTTTTIPTDALIERNFADWADQYDSEEQFEKQTEYTISYITQEHPQGSWNYEVQQTVLKSYNFYSMIGERDADGELVALLATKDQLTNNREYPLGVEEWIAYKISKHTLPSSIEGIDSRIYEIVDTDRNYVLALEMFEAKIYAASLGVVPSELIESDTALWGQVFATFACEKAEKCDVEELKKNYEAPGEPLHNSAEEVAEFLANMSAKMIAYLLPSMPQAFAAWDDTYHIAYQYIDANSCDNNDDPCSFYDTDDGVGTITANASSGTIHTEEIYVYSYAQSYGGNAGDYHVVSSQLTDPAATNTLVAAGYDGVIKTGYLTKSSNESTYKATNTSDAYDP